jgi:hypothetical protein
MSTTLRSSGASKPNPSITESPANAARLSNTAWLERRPKELRNAVLLLGGTNLVHFRLRCAQAVMRRDLLPSFWSQVGLLRDDDTVMTIPVDTLADVSRVPDANGVEIVPISVFDSTHRFPNIAVMRFSLKMETLIKLAEEVSPHREQLSVPVLIVRWLACAWALDDDRNPLIEGVGIPSARWLENVFAAAGVELAPGLGSGASCPEAVWQAARWWHEFYAPRDGEEASELGRRDAISPEGIYVIRQPAAALLGPRDSKDGSPKGGSQKRSKEFNPI